MCVMWGTVEESLCALSRKLSRKIGVASTIVVFTSNRIKM